MPNWCSNCLTISSKQQDVIKNLRAKLVEAEKVEKANNGGMAGLLTVIAPIPEYVPEEWYRLHNDYWGTKWDVPFNDCYFSELSDDCISVSFETAWGPPTGACKALLAELLKIDEDVIVKCTFEEGGLNFIGYWENGKHKEETIDELYVALLDKDEKALEFASMVDTCLEDLAANFFCIADYYDDCHCYNCDPINPVRGYQNPDEE